MWRKYRNTERKVFFPNDAFGNIPEFPVSFMICRILPTALEERRSEELQVFFQGCRQRKKNKKMKKKVCPNNKSETHLLSLWKKKKEKIGSTGECFLCPPPEGHGVPLFSGYLHGEPNLYFVLILCYMTCMTSLPLPFIHPNKKLIKKEKKRDPQQNAACEQQGAAGKVRRGLSEWLILGLRAAAPTEGRAVRRDD